MVEGLGDGDDGLLWERNPEKHRRVSKMISPAFSGNSLRAKVPTMNKYIDLMMIRLKELGTQENGVDLSRVWKFSPLSSTSTLARETPFH
jgi:cytochrome P450